MLMAIDVGNTNMVFGLLEGETLVGSFRLMTDTNRTSDEIGLTVCEYFRRFNWRPTGPRPGGSRCRTQCLGRRHHPR